MSQSVEPLPAPESVLPESRIRYQAMTELSNEEYRRLADDIRENGVLQPVVVDDSPEQVIIDGHHREAIAQHYDLPESKKPAYVVVGGLGEEEKLSRAIKQNLIGRDTTEGVKSHAVKQYIELSWDRTDGGDLIRPETDTEVAEKLGVDNSLVGRVVKNLNVQIIDHDRVKARRYYEENPDASYREVARQVDSAKATVTEWIKEDFDEGGDEDDEQPTLMATTTDATEAEKAGEVFRRSEDEDDEDIRDEAEANAERLTRGDTSPTTANKNVEMAEAEKELEADRDAGPEHEYTPTIERADAREWISGSAPAADVVVTDPPYTTDIDDVSEFAASWVPDVIGSVYPDGYAYIFIGSYADELEAYLRVLSETDFYVQPLVWNYRNTLGRSPDDRYKRDWQAVLYCRGPDAGDLNAPKTSELRSVQEVNAPGMVGDGAERHHEWQKPRELVEQYIRHATEQGDTVIDPFAGSGEILLAAADVGRRAAGCDLDRDAVDTAVGRGCVRDE